MSRAQIVLLAVLLVVGLFIAWLAFRTEQPPILPDDSDHRPFVDAETCNVCHGPDGGQPKPMNHTPRQDCLQCHGID